MPTRRRIGQIMHPPEVTIGEGGGGVETAAVGPWGPDFGESSGSDGITHTTTVTQRPLELVQIAGTLTQPVTLTDGALRATYVNPIAQPTVLSGRVYGPPFWQTVASNALLLPLAGGSISCNVPTGTQSGELLVARYSTSAATGTPSPDQAGWTLVNSVTLSGATLIAWWRIATGSEPASYSFSTAAGVGNQPPTIVAIHRIRGADPTTPINASNTATASTTSTTVNIPSATSTAANTLRLAFGTVANLTNAAQTDYSFTPAASFVERVDHGQTTGGTVPNTDAADATRILAAIGASGAASMTITPTPLTNISHLGMQVLIAPDTAGVAL